MNAFPQSIHFIGSNMPRRMEISVRDLAVEGEIPAEIDGAFFRAVPDNAHAHYNLGLLDARAGRYADAVSHFDRAHALDPGDVDIARALAEARAALERR